MPISCCCRAGVSILLLAGAIATANAAGELQFSTPQSFIAVAPGGTAQVALHIANIADEASDPTTVQVWKQTGYTFAIGGPAGCRGIHDFPDPAYVGFDLPSLPAGASLDCTFAVTRSADGIDDLRLSLRLPILHTVPDVIFGTFADIALSNERVSYSVDTAGVAHGVFRVIAKNVGTVPVDAFNAETCSYERTFTYNIVGGCAPTTSLCARGQVPYYAQGVLLPALGPGEETSCLVEVSRPFPEGPFDTLRLDQIPDWDEWLIDTSTGGKVYDPNVANNSTILDAPAAPAAGAIPASTFSPFSAALLGACLLGAAWASRRRLQRNR